MNDLELVTIVCTANYCRSPVAEALLNEKYRNKYKFASYGIEPIAKSNMDDRSMRFLAKQNIHNILHAPKRLNGDTFNKSRHIFAVDMQVLLEINKRFGVSSKTKLLSFQNPKIILKDPFKFPEDAYEFEMEKIKKVCQELVI